MNHEDWPDDPENPELARFAENLAAHLPALPDDRLARAQEQVVRELAATPRRRRWLAASASAAVLAGLAWCGYAYYPSTQQPNNRIYHERLVRITDCYEVQFNPGNVTPITDRPLLPVDKYSSLYAQGE